MGGITDNKINKAEYRSALVGGLMRAGLAALLLTLAFAGSAWAECPPAVAGYFGTRLDTQTADAVRITGGCIQGVNLGGTYRFPVCKNHTGDDTAAVQKIINDAPSNGATIVFPKENVCSISSLSVTKNNITFSGGTLTLGVGLSAGQIAVTIDANNFRARDVTATAAVRVIAFDITPTAARSGFLFDNISCTDFLYCVVGAGTSSFRLSHVTVQNSSSTQPAGQNAGAFLMQFTDNYMYLNNRISGGQNTSVLGSTSSTGGRIIGNYERGVVDTVAATEACIQIEFAGANSDSIIADNDCSHDIWLSDSGGVKVSNNIARRLRAQVVGNGPDGTTVNPDKIEVVGGTYGQLLVGHYSATATTQRLSAKFANLDLDPARYTLLSVALDRSYSLDGTYAGTLTFSNIRNVSNATARATSIIRDAAADMFFSDCDFGTATHFNSGGTAGLVNERNNINPISTLGNGYIYVYQGTNIASPTLSAWTDATYSVTLANRNGEWASNRFTPLVSAYYEFGCSMGNTPTAAGNEFGLRLVTDPAGTPVEIARLADTRSADTNAVVAVCRPYTAYIAAGTVLGFQYFITGASSNILGSAGIYTTASIRRVGH